MNKHNNIHSHTSESLHNEVIKFLEWYPVYENYVKMSATPLSTIATSNSALTITSLLLFLNATTYTVELLALINLTLLIFTSSLSIFFLIATFRANFRFSRVKFRIHTRNYDTTSDYSPADRDELVFLTHLAQKGYRTIDTMEFLYQNALWRYFFIFTFFSFILLVVSLFAEFHVRLI